MAACSQDLECVARLVFRRTAQPALERSRAVYPNDEFDIGRRMVRDVLDVQDQAVSTHHIRIHCVMYEDDEARQVAPMIYARVLSKNPVIIKRSVLDAPDCSMSVSRDQPDVLLSFGDVLQITRNISIELEEVEGVSSYPPALDSIRQAETQKFASRYRMTGRVLGVGGYATVYVAVKQKTHQQYACKVIRILSSSGKKMSRQGELCHKSDVPESEFRKRLDMVTREYNLLKTLSHPNIVTLEKVFRTTCSVYIFQELITGGDLIAYLDKEKQLSEPNAAIIIRQLLEAVKYLHSNDVVHRDIKPENILMTTWRDGGRIVLTDFGQSMARPHVDGAAKPVGVLRMHTFVGTNGYFAPELYRQLDRPAGDGNGYSQAVDVWAVGCVTMLCLTNESVFPDSFFDERATMSQFNAHLNVLDTEYRWAHISRRAKDLIRGCLAPHEDERLTAEQCLALSWFQHPQYKAEFDAAYRRAIQGWKPRLYDAAVVETIDTNDILRQHAQQEVDTRSSYFPTQAVRPPLLPPLTPLVVTSKDIDMVSSFRAHASSADAMHVPDTPPHQPIDDDDDSMVEPPPSLPPSLSTGMPHASLLVSTSQSQCIASPPSSRDGTFQDPDHNLQLASQNLSHNMQNVDFVPQ